MCSQRGLANRCWDDSLGSDHPGVVQADQELFQVDVVIVVVRDAKRFTGRVHASIGIEFGSVDAQVDVAQERAEQEHQVTLFDKLRDRLVPDRALVQPDEKRMPFADDTLAEHGRGDWNVRRFGELEQFILQTESVNLDSGDDDRILGLGKPIARSRESPRRSPPDRFDE